MRSRPKVRLGLLHLWNEPRTINLFLAALLVAVVLTLPPKTSILAAVSPPPAGAEATSELWRIVRGDRAQESNYPHPGRRDRPVERGPGGVWLQRRPARAPKRNVQLPRSSPGRMLTALA